MQRYKYHNNMITSFILVLKYGVLYKEQIPSVDTKVEMCRQNKQRKTSFNIKTTSSKNTSQGKLFKKTETNSLPNDFLYHGLVQGLD